MKKIFLLLLLASFSADAQLMIRHTWMKDYLAVLAASTTAGHTSPTYDQRKKQNRIVLRAEKLGWWDQIDVFWMFCNNGSADFARFNWKNPAAFKLTLQNSPTFTSNVGFTGNGSNMYIDTGWAPGTDGVQFTRNAAFSCFKTTSDIAEAASLFGVDGSASNVGRFHANPENAGGTIVYAVNGATVLPLANASSAGIYTVSRDGSTSTDVYKNGVTFTSAGDTSDPMSTRTVPILVFKNNANVLAPYTTRNIWWLTFGGITTPQSWVDVYTVLNDYVNQL